MNPDILEEEILSKTTRIIMNKLDEAKICKRIKIGKIPKNQITRMITSTISMELLQDLTCFHGINMDISETVTYDILYQVYCDLIKFIKEKANVLNKDYYPTADGALARMYELLHKGDIVISPSIPTILNLKYKRINDYTLLDIETNKLMYTSPNINEPLTIISAPNDLTINIESISDELNIRKEDFSPLYTIKLTYSLYTNYESLESYILSNPCD
ncbi:MAG: hypothetical protein M0R17_01185 [Candidatus Omnitrophica bacterium]|jgi:hypothetical protein|nr:hypothetical protein [Candidatus Omnitrophota bacterium]